MTPLAMPPVAIGPLAPVLIVLGAAGLVLLLDLLPRPVGRELIATVALAGLVGALLATLAAIIAAATPVVAVIGSPAMPHPSAMATSGFT